MTDAEKVKQGYALLRSVNDETTLYLTKKFGIFVSLIDYIMPNKKTKTTPINRKHLPLRNVVYKHLFCGVFIWS